MHRRWWRHYRDAPDTSDLRRRAFGAVASLLRVNDEIDAADRLDEEVLRGLPRDHHSVLLSETYRAAYVMRTDPGAALDILTWLVHGWHSAPK
mmetsp:Transcript_9790/g.39852  ORF Transcript_9790/g.39852 Transcript_9790/m.39852 type:complete len:93 (+) Transcript_9790:122-400(+)